MTRHAVAERIAEDVLVARQPEVLLAVLAAARIAQQALAVHVEDERGDVRVAVMAVVVSGLRRQRHGPAIRRLTGQPDHAAIGQGGILAGGRREGPGDAVPPGGISQGDGELGRGHAEALRCARPADQPAQIVHAGALGQPLDDAGRERGRLLRIAEVEVAAGRERSRQRVAGDVPQSRRGQQIELPPVRSRSSSATVT